MDFLQGNLDRDHRADPDWVYPLHSRRAPRNRSYRCGRLAACTRRIRSTMRAQSYGHLQSHPMPAPGEVPHSTIVYRRPSFPEIRDRPDNRILRAPINNGGMWDLAWGWHGM